MAISEQLVIKATLDTSAIASQIDGLRSQFQKLTENDNISLDNESKRSALIAERLQKEIDSLAKLEAIRLEGQAKLEAIEQERITKIEAAERVAEERREQAAEKQAAREADRQQKLLETLEKQQAAAQVKTASASGDSSAKQDALIFQEAIRFKQELAKIDRAGFSKEDADNAKKLAEAINSTNLEKISKDFEKVSVGTRTFTGNLKDSAELLGVAAGKIKEFQQEASAAFGEQRKAQGALSIQADDTKSLSSALKVLANDLKNQVSVATLTNDAAAVASKGYRDTTSNIQVLGAVEKLAISSQTDFRTALDTTNVVLKAFKIPAAEAASVVDQIASTSRVSGLSISELSGQYERLSSTAAATGTTFTQLNSFIANARSSGVSARDSIAALSSTLDKLQSGELIKKGRELGINFDEQAVKSKGLSQVLKELTEKGYAGNTEALNALFGNAKNVGAVLPSLSSGLNTVASASGLVNKNFETVSGFNKAESSANQLKDALAEIGAAVAPFTTSVTGSLRAITEAFAKLDPSAKTLIGTFAGVVGAGFAISSVVTATLAIVTPTIGAFTALAGAIGLKTAAETASVASSGAAAIATGAFASAQAFLTTPITANNVQLLIFDARLALVSAKQAIATATTAGFAGATGILAAAQQQLAISLALANTAALPLIATFAAIAAAAAVLAIQLKANEIAETNQTLDGTQKGVDALGDSAIAAATRTRNLTDRLAELRNQGKAASTEQVENAKNLIKANEERIRAINAEAEALKNTKVADEGKARRDAQIKDFELAANTLKKQNQALDEQLKLSANIKTSFSESNAISEEKLKKLREEAKLLQENAIADRERTLSRQQQDQKTVREQKTETKIETVKRTEDAQLEAIKADGDRRKRELDAKQQVETQNLQARFNETENQKEVSNKQKIEDLKKSAQEGRLAEERKFTEEQNRAKAEFSKKERELEDAANEARKKRDATNTEAFKSAKDAASNASELAKAKPEDRDRILRQQQEEERIRQAARQIPLQQNQTKEGILSTAKGIAGSDKDPVEEARKVALAISAIEEEQKKKQAEIDRAEDLKREEEKRKREEEFSKQQELKKREFDDGQKKAEVEFLQKTIQPIETEFANQKKQRELEFQQGALAELKRKQQLEDDALKAAQAQQEKETRLAFEAEIKKIKDEAKQQELAIDRANEDAKIARERAFKAEQRALDEASAVKILQILGQAKNNIVPINKPPEPTGTDGGGIVDSLANSILNKVPKFETGVSGFAGGLAVVGEKGAELVSLPRGANVIPNNRLASLSPIDNRTVTPSIGNNKRMELLLEKLIGSVDRPNLTIETTKDPVSAAADFYQNMVASKARQMGL